MGKKKTASDYGYRGRDYYMHPNSGVVRTVASWVDGMIGNNIADQLNQLIPVMRDKKTEEWVEWSPILKAASTMGRKGGAAKTEAKKQASRKNGTKGGRPIGLKSAEAIQAMVDLIKKHGHVSAKEMSVCEAAKYVYGSLYQHLSKLHPMTIWEIAGFAAGKNRSRDRMIVIGGV